MWSFEKNLKHTQIHRAPICWLSPQSLPPLGLKLGIRNSIQVFQKGVRGTTSSTCCLPGGALAGSQNRDQGHKEPGYSDS